MRRNTPSVDCEVCQLRTQQVRTIHLKRTEVLWDPRDTGREEKAKRKKRQEGSTRAMRMDATRRQEDGTSAMRMGA